MKQVGCFLLLVLLSGIPLIAQTFTASGGNKSVYVVHKEELGNAELENVFLFYGMNGAQLTYTSPAAASTISWFRYQNNPADRMPLTGNQTGNVSVLATVEPDYGYIVNDDGTEYAVWVVDYTRYISDLQKLTVVEDDNKCSSLFLQLTADIPDIPYHKFTDGTPEYLVRTYKIAYKTLEWDGNNQIYNPVNDTVAVINVDSPIKVTSPLTDTDFILWEDHFAVYFDEDVSVVSDVYTAIRVEAHAEVVTAARDNPNEKNSPTSSSTSGSAPLDVNFIAYVSDAVQHYSWEFSSREDFSVLLATYPESELHYIFDRTGKYYVRLNVSDYANNCSEIALESPFIIEVSESFIEAPNYFTPNSSTDINDQFKVSYQSINKFKCTIFNRWGNFIYEYYDPAGGWDGKKDGKLVPPGVYFYVIEADGSDGIKHKLKGDINLLYKK